MTTPTRSRMLTLAEQTAWNRKTQIHQPARVDCTFGVYTFHAYCGHVSTNKNEFRKEKWGLDRVTCEKCRERVLGKKAAVNQ